MSARKMIQHIYSTNTYAIHFLAQFAVVEPYSQQSSHNGDILGSPPHNLKEVEQVADDEG